MKQVLIFRLGSEWFGLQISCIQEISEMPQLDYIPRAPVWLMGAMNFHGNIMPVLDLGAYLGIESLMTVTKVVVMPPGQEGIALGVTDVFRIVHYDPDDCLPCRHDTKQKKFIQHLYDYEGLVVNMFDISTLIEELKTI
ncbi:MAG: chemotaxis protein CheW [Desulfuromonadales bacterium]|nr:chemotaxis protein CheW [Desulfuromonadales bacterium]